MEQFKLGWKLLRYAYGIKTCMGWGIVFLVGGTALTFLPHGLGFMGIFFLMMGSLWISQLYFSLGVSNMAQSSPRNRQLQTVIPTMICFVINLVEYLIVLLVSLPRLAGAGEEELKDISAMWLYAAFIGFMLMVYTGTAYKLFVISTIIFFVVFYGIPWGWIPLPSVTVSSVWQAAAVGFGMIVLGALVQYGLSRLVYKLPMAKNGQLKALQKIM